MIGFSRSHTRFASAQALGFAAIATLLAAAGCGGGGASSKVEAKAGPRIIVVTAELVERIPVQRVVEVVGTLKGWDEVTIGSKQTGRVVEVLHDIGDRVKPGEPLVKLDPTDADLAIQQAESQLLGELIKLELNRDQAEEFVKRYGFSEKLLADQAIIDRIEKLPAIKQADATWTKSKQDLARFRQLSNRDAATMQELQTAENSEQVAKAALDNARMTARTVIATALTTRIRIDQARQTLKDMVISVPTPSVVPTGVESRELLTFAVTRRVAAEGQMLRPGDPVMDLILDDPLRLWANVPERYASEIALGQPIDLTVASYPGQTFRGEVSRINPSVNPDSRTFQVEARVPNHDRRLRPGSFAKAKILTREDKSVTVVPLVAVVRDSGVVKLFLFDADDKAGVGRGLAREVRVKTGREQDRKVEIIDGLPEGSKVVTSGQTQLADGFPIVLRAEQPAVADDKSAKSPPNAE
jgi:multidrug efflux pump subunit AcrA (membrane-fusion protein)